MLGPSSSRKLFPELGFHQEVECASRVEDELLKS